MCEVIENPVVDGWKKAKFSTEKIIGIVPTFSKLEFIFCGISKKIGYINFSISIDNLFGEDSLGVRTVYDDFDITDVPVIEQIPSGFILNQNYPNPFNPTTSIMFSSPKESNVSLKIYNILGEEVAELVNKLMPAGNHTIGFDTTGLSSGIYLYRLKAGGFVESKKMILMK